MNDIINYIENQSHSKEEQALLPHLYGYPWYDWAWKFFISKNDFNFICAANQISKSSTLIRKNILRATAPDLWKFLWPRLKKAAPSPFWYFYPSQGLATEEFEEKWVPEFLPRGAMERHEIFGWKPKYAYQKIHSLTFNSGVTIYFKSYEQKGSVQQAGSIYYISCDEELPEERFGELDQRRSAVDGYFDMVFTATIGQRFWWRAIEGRGKNEAFPEAFKQQISKWDCLNYMDGSPSFWTPEKIRKEEARCRNEVEKLVRIHGRFIRDFNVLLPSFSSGNLIKASKLKSGKYVAGIYVSKLSGLAGIVVLKVSESFDQAEIVDFHYFDDKDVSSIEMYVVFANLAKKYKFERCFCNAEGKDFIDASRGREPYIEALRMPKFQAAKMMNSLFKFNVLALVDRNAEADDFVYQLQNADKDDDQFKECELVGALILVCDNIPWKFNRIMGFVDPVRSEPQYSERERFWLGIGEYKPRTSNDSYDNDFEDLNHQLESFDEGFENYG